MANGVKPADAWVVAAIVPVFCATTWVSALAWGAAVLAGALLAGARPLRWVAVGWAAAAAVPGAPLVGIAAAGAMGPATLAHVEMAIVGSLAAWAVPAQFRSAGVLLMVAAAVAAVMKRKS